MDRRRVGSKDRGGRIWSGGGGPNITEGTIRTLGQWATGSEPYVNNVANQPFYLDKIDRALVYGDYPWYGRGWRYADGAAIYSSASPNLATYGAQVLKDASNNNLFLHRFTPANNADPSKWEYAADPGSSVWRSAYNARVTAALQSGTGMCGVMVDDVNPGLAANTYSSADAFVDSIDPRTGAAMTPANWNKYIAEFIEGVKAVAPNAEVVSNMHWPDGNNGFTRGFNDPYIARIIDASDYIMLENGLQGMTGDNDVAWTFSFSALRDFVDFCRTKNTNLAWFTYNHIDLEYELAMYFLFSSGQDYIGVILTSGDPATYNTMYDIDLGAALGARYQTTLGGVVVWRRDFTNGFILVNGPGMGTVTAAPLGGSYVNTSGATVTTITLTALQGAVLRNP